MGYLSKRRSETRKQLEIWVFSILIFTLSAVGSFIDGSNFADNIANYRVFYMYLSGIAFILNIVGMNFKAAFITILAFVINFSNIASHSDLFREIPDPKEIWAEPVIKKIAVINVMGEKSSYIKMMKWLNDEKPDYTIIINAIDTDFLKILSRRFKHTVSGKKITLFTNDDYIEAESEENGILWARFATENSRHYAIMAVSLPKTDNAEEYEDYREKCAEIAKTSNKFDDPVILAGGLNAAPWTDKMNALDEVSFKTNILHGNYPSYLPKMMRKPVDYIYTHSGIDIISQKTGKNNGSRHLPVTATVSIRPL